MLGNAVRLAGERPCEAVPPPVEVKAPVATNAPPAAAPPKGESFAGRLKKRLRAITRRWFGG